MDKRTLNPEELQQLKQFIISRSERFAEPAVLCEIMDHFACKIEEELEEYPTLSFEAGIKKAYQSFGAKGFAPIADAFERGVHREYSQWYKKEWQNVLLSREGLKLFLFVIIIFWTEQISGPRFFGQHLVILVPVLTAISVIYLWILRLNTMRKAKEHMLYYRQAEKAGNYILAWNLFAFLPLVLKDTISFPFLLVLVLLGALLASIHAIVYKNLMQKVKEDVTGIQQLLQSF